MIAAVSFDVWDTLLKTSIVYRRLANTISIMKTLDPVVVESTIYSVYKALRELRLHIDDDSSARAFVNRSREVLARALRMEHDEVAKAIDITLSSMDLGDLVFEDVRPALDTLEYIGVRMGIVGNTIFWESIYTRELLERLELKKYFKVQLYSDEVGIFKPDKKIFLELCRRLDVKPSEVIHVGDNVVEDVGGALSSGMKAVLVSRSGSKTSLPSLGVIIIPSLGDLIEVVEMFK